MKHILIALPMVVLACGQIAGRNTNEDLRLASGMTKDVNLVQFAKDNNQFALDFFQALDKQQPGKNIFVSPASLSVAFGMAYSGADQDTKAELAKVLHLSTDQDLVDKSFGAFLKTLSAEKQTQGFDLAFANRFWAQKGFGWKASYLDRLSQYYNSGVSEYDFAGDPAAIKQAVADINQWASQNTNGKIDHVVSENDLDDSTRFVLTNATYFQGQWVVPFPRDEKDGLQKKSFFLADQTKSLKPTEVDFLINSATFKYYEDKDVQVLELPYKSTKLGDNLSMVILLPAKNNSAKDLVAGLDADKFDRLVSKMTPKEVAVEIPAFELKKDFRLADLLSKELGMDKAFSDNADFSKMNGRKDIKLSEVIHNTFIRVDNKGTQAAAVTAILGTLSASWPPEPKKEFVANRPFVYAIRHNATNAILFMGVEMNPAVGN